jgi:phage gp45-like
MGLLTWAKVSAARALAGKLGLVQSDAPRDDEFQHWQPYGFQARPLAGADAIVVSMGSNADQRIALLVGDRRYTIALEAGEVAIVDDLGQKVHLTRTGIVVDAPGIKLGASATLAAARETDPISMGNPATPGTWAFWAAAVATATSTTAPRASRSPGPARVGR